MGHFYVNHIYNIERYIVGELSRVIGCKKVYFFIQYFYLFVYLTVVSRPKRNNSWFAV